MADPRKVFGASAEELAARYLQQKGHKILGRNVKLDLGEIDLLTLDGATVVIVEVKARRSDQLGHPADKVDRQKQNKLRQLAKLLEIKYPDRVLRIDVVAIDYSNPNPIIDYFPSAVDGVS